MHSVNPVQYLSKNLKIELINSFLLNRKLIFSLNLYTMYIEKYQITSVSLKTTNHDNAQEVS